MDMNKEESAALSCLGALFALIVIVVGSAVGEGLALSVLWRWFAVPLFDAPALTLWQAFGVSLVVSAATSKGWDSDSDSDKSSVEYILKAIGFIIARPLVLIAMGWVVKGLAF